MLRSTLVETALRWEQRYANVPAIIGVIAEYDAARLLGMSDEDFAEAMRGATSVRRGYDFLHLGLRYQIKGNRPSGKPGSAITMVRKPSNFEWDFLIWIRYDTGFNILEAWCWDVSRYRAAFRHCARLSPSHMRGGTPLIRGDA